MSLLKAFYPLLTTSLFMFLSHPHRPLTYAFTPTLTSFPFPPPYTGTSLCAHTTLFYSPLAFISDHRFFPSHTSLSYTQKYFRYCSSHLCPISLILFNLPSLYRSSSSTHPSGTLHTTPHHDFHSLVKTTPTTLTMAPLDTTSSPLPVFR